MPEPPRTPTCGDQTTSKPQATTYRATIVLSIKRFLPTFLLLFLIVKYAGHYAKEVALGTAADTAWDVGVNGKEAGTAFTESLAGNMVGQAFGDSLSGVMRKGLSGIADNAPGWAKNLRLCFAAGTPAEMSEAQFGELAACVDRVREAIEDLDLGRRVLAENPVAAALAETSEPNSSWSRVVLRPLDESDDAQIELLRSPAWLSANRAKIGATIDLDLPELNLRGPAKIVSISVGPAIIPGNGRVVTGLFRHTARELLEVHVEGLPQPIVGTPRHPYWSATRQAFVPAEKLHVGEELQSSDGGTVRVTALVFRSEPTTVYNIEVHGEHVYHVSPLGLLVHNASQKLDDVAPRNFSEAIDEGLKVRRPQDIGIHRPERHHIFPQEHRQFFKDRNFTDIDSFTIPLDEATHSSIHTWMGSGRWNDVIIERILARESELGDLLNRKQIMQLGAQMRREAGLQHIKIIPFQD